MSIQRESIFTDPYRGDVCFVDRPLNSARLLAKYLLLLRLRNSSKAWEYNKLFIATGSEVFIYVCQISDEYK